MRILANDGLEKIGIDYLKKNGIEVDTQKRSRDKLLEDIKNFDGIIVRSATKVDQEIIESGKNKLKIIGRAGVGYDNVDVDAATRNGVIVKFAPHGNTNATAEHTFAMMLALSRNIPQAHHTLNDGQWLKKQYKGCEVTGKTLGIIGCGRIGTRLSELVRGFDMTVLGYDPYATEHSSAIEYVESLDELLVNADYVSVHAGGKNSIINKRELELMKSTAYLINVSRGNNIDEKALYEALSNKVIAGAAIDVFVIEGKEGQEFIHPYTGLENIIVTPHLGASTNEAQEKTALEMAEVVAGYLLKGDWHNAVNAHEEVKDEGKEIYQMFVTHKDRPGMFGQIDDILGKYAINIRDHPSRKIGQNGAQRVQTTYLIQQPLTDEIKSEIVNLDGVYFVKD